MARDDIVRGAGAVNFIPEKQYTIDSSKETRFECVDKDGNPIVPDIYDVLVNWAEKKNISLEKMAHQFVEVLFNQIRLDNPHKMTKPQMLWYFTEFLKAVQERHKDKSWRLDESIVVSIGGGYEDHAEGIRALVIDCDPEDGSITWMPDWGCGEKMFRRYFAGGVGGPKAEVWRQNLEYNFEKTGFKKGIRKFEGTGKGKTAVILGNGPSLRRNSEFIRKHDDIILMSCNSALTLFDRETIDMMDFFMIVDHNDSDKTKKWLFETDNKGEVTDKPREFNGHIIANVTCMKNMTDAFGDRIHWSTGSDIVAGMTERFEKDKWPKKKLQKYLHKNELDWMDVIEKKDCWEILPEGRWARKLGWICDSKTVLLYLMHFAWWTLGVESIVLTGADFGSSPDLFWTPQEQCAWKPGMYTDADYLGWPVQTLPHYETARRQTEMACIFLTDAGCPVINASEGGRLQWPLRMKLQEVYENMPIKAYIQKTIEEMKAAEKQELEMAASHG